MPVDNRRSAIDNRDMASRQDPPPRKRGKKVRVQFKRNRSPRARTKDLTQQARDAEGHELDTTSREHIRPKGDLSRQRTIIVHDNDDTRDEDSLFGVVVTMRGLYADVDDGKNVWPCTVRRILRTRLIDQRHPVTVGDHVRFKLNEPDRDMMQEGVIEEVDTRQGQLCRLVNNRVQTIAANVDQAIIVSSAAQPEPRTGLIDRYIVAALYGEIAPIICMNKIDLDDDGFAASLLPRYVELGYPVLATSTITGEGIDEVRSLLNGKVSVVAGQSGVGKSALLNALQPGLALRTNDVTRETGKGRHTTTTAIMIRLNGGGYVVDTPGIRSFDLTIVPRNEFEMHFVDIAKFVPDCKFADCTHTHENDCAVKEAVERGDIHPERYESYVRLFEAESIGFD